MALEIMITVGGSDYYVSDEGHNGASFGATAGSQYYYPFVAKPPRLTWGPIGGGYISVQAGSLTLVNKPYDSSHPFSGTNYRNMLSDAGSTSNVPTIAIKDSTKFAIFDGTLILQQITSEIIRFTIEGPRYNFHLAEDTVTDSDGDTVNIPWPFGQIEGRQWIVYKGSNVWANGTARHPGFNSTAGINIVEEGVNLYSSEAFTATEITGSGGTTYGGKQVSVSFGQGTKLSGDVDDSDDITAYMSDLHYYISRDIGINPSYGINNDKASGSTSLGIAIYQTEPIQDLDLFSIVCDSVNYQFYITRNQNVGEAGTGALTVYLVDRANNPTATVLTKNDIIESTYRITRPLAQVSTSFNSMNWRGTQLANETIDIVSNNLEFGRITRKPQYMITHKSGSSYESVSSVQTRMNAIRDIEKKPIASVTVDGIQDTYTPGDRFTFNREQDHIKVDMLARSISWDWGKRQTTVSGDATLSIYEAS